MQRCWRADDWTGNVVREDRLFHLAVGRVHHFDIVQATDGVNDVDKIRRNLRVTVVGVAGTASNLIAVHRYAEDPFDRRRRARYVNQKPIGKAVRDGQALRSKPVQNSLLVLDRWGQIARSIPVRSGTGG